MNRPAFIGLLVLPMLISLMRCSSTYKLHQDQGPRMISESVIIDAPVPTVFHYLGNSANASDWSVFVDHITVLNPETVTDGMPGSQRRCFVKENESGIQWDEEIKEVWPDSLRTLTVYNLKGFTLTVDGLKTNQIYERLPGQQTRLTFTLHFGESTPTLPEQVKTHLVSPKVSRIFRENLSNIKDILENSHNNPVSPNKPIQGE